MIIRTLINTVIAIVLIVGVVIYQVRLQEATTDLVAIKNGFSAAMMSLYLMVFCILVKMDQKE